MNTSFVATLKDRSKSAGPLQIMADGSSSVLLEMPESELAQVIKLNTLLGKAFTVTITDER